METMEDITICIDDQHAMEVEAYRYPNCEHMVEETEYTNTYITEWKKLYGDNESVSIESNDGKHRVVSVLSIESVHCKVFYIIKHQQRTYYGREIRLNHIVDKINFKLINSQYDISYKLFRINDQPMAKRRRMF